MSQKTYPFPELRETSRFFTEKDSRNHALVKEMDQLRLRDQLVLVDSTAGVENVKLPIAARSQGVTFTIIKISADANNVNAVRQSTDKVNKPGTWNATSVLVGAAQGSHMQFKTDGISQWYQSA